MANKPLIKETFFSCQNITTTIEKTKWAYRAMKEKNSVERKLLLMSIFGFLAVIGYNLMRCIKDALVLNLTSVGAIHIPFIKSLVVMPLTFALSALFLYLKHKVGMIKTYFYLVGGMLVYFLLYAFVLEAHLEQITLSSHDALVLTHTYPLLRFIFDLLRQWPGALFYALAELWGLFSLFILYWGVANELFTIKEAKYTYPILQLVGSIGLYVSAFIIDAVGNFHQTIIVGALVICAIFAMIMLILMQIKPYLALKETKRTETTKKKLSFSESVAIAITSPYILAITASVVALNVLMNIFDNNLAEMMSKLYPGTGSYMQYMSIFTSLKGKATIITNLITIFFVHRMRWSKMLLVTPVICIISVNLFLIATLLNKSNWAMSFGFSEYHYAWSCCFILAGIYATKYAFFDTTKEMALIPLSSEMRGYGKAASDAIGSRLGKSGCSFLQMSLLSLSGGSTFIDIADPLLIVCLITSIIWITALFKIQKDYTQMTQSTSDHLMQDQTNTLINT